MFHMIASKRVRRWTWLLQLVLLILPCRLVAVEQAPLASDEQVKEAFGRFQAFLALDAYIGISRLGVVQTVSAP